MQQQRHDCIATTAFSGPASSHLPLDVGVRWHLQLEDVGGRSSLLDSPIELEELYRTVQPRRQAKVERADELDARLAGAASETIRIKPPTPGPRLRTTSSAAAPQRLDRVVLSEICTVTSFLRYNSEVSLTARSCQRNTGTAQSAGACRAAALVLESLHSEYVQGPARPPDCFQMCAIGSSRGTNGA